MQELVDECAERMRYNNARQFIFDLHGVEYLSSACLGVLVNFMQDVEHFRGRIAVAGCQPNVAFLFKVTNLERVFGLYDDTADAAGAL
jgi:anti-sigma B factor antagonist